MRKSGTNASLKQTSESSQNPENKKTHEIQESAVLDAIPACVWSAAPDGNIVFCNKRWLEYLGMALEEVQSGGLGAAVHPKDKAGFAEKWRAAIARGEGLEAEARIRRADGRYCWFLIRATPVHDAVGEIIRWYGTSVEIEELKQANEEVREQTSRWDELFEQTPEAVAVLSADDRVLRINKEFTRIFGYELDEVLERPINDLIVPERLAENAQQYTDQLQHGSRVELETIRKHKDGSEVHVSLLAVPIIAASGEQVANYVIYRDITERKRAVERAVESEVRFQAIADTAPVMIWTTGTDGLCNYFSKPWLEFTGRTLEQEVGAGWLASVHPDDAQVCEDGYWPRFQARKPFRMEYRLKRADGEYRWVDERGIPRYTTGGEFAGYIGCNIDITERKRAESLLSGEKRILEMLAKGDSLSEILNALCRLVEEQADEALASILLLDGNRLRHGGAPSLPKAYTDVIDGAMIGPSAGSCGTAAYRGEQVIVEDIVTDPLWTNYRDLALPHSLRACWSTPVFSSQGKIVATFAMYYREPRKPTLRDQQIIEQITHLAGVAIERKLIQEALRRSEAYLAEAQRLTHTGSWAWSLRTGELFWSQELCRMYGLDPQTKPTWPWFLNTIHPEDRAKVARQAQMESTERNWTVSELEFRIVLSDGTVKHVHAISYRVTDDLGETTEVMGTVMDVTERKRAEKERERLRQLEADLAHMNRVSMMGELAAALAHEIKQPITAAATNARTCFRWLVREPADLQEARDAASRVVTEVNRAAEIMTRIRSLYTKGGRERELINVNELIEEMIVLLRNDANRQSIRISSNLAENLPRVMADRVQLQQALLNLMVNGMEAMKETTGELRVRSERSESGQVLIAVSDTGIGLPHENANSIFDAFFTTKPHGTGMGLAITRSIIEEHGGRLWAEANAFRGATFQFALPVEMAAHA